MGPKMPCGTASTSRTWSGCRCTARPRATTLGPNPCAAGAHLWAAADIIRPALVVIDPALDAYTGDPNNLAAVREFVSALGAAAAARSCGVLLVAHSRKAARGKDSDPFDPGQVGGVGSVGRRRQGSPDTDRPGRQPHTGNRQGQLGPRLRPGAARAGVQRCRSPDRLRRAERLD